MAKNKNLSQLSELAETLKSQTDIPQQTIIPTAELENLKQQAEQPPKERRKGTCTLSISIELIERLDSERAKAPFNPSRSDFVEHILKEYFYGK